jgi:RHS repeat-associated protein
MGPSQLSAGATFETYDDQYFDMTGTGTSSSWHAITDNRVVNNYVHLKYTGAATTYYATPWTMQVILEVSQWNEFGAASLPVICTLSVSYDNGVKTQYKDVATYKSVNGHRCKVKVNSVSFTGGISAVPADVMIENVVEVERVYDMQWLAAADLSHTVDGAPCILPMPDGIDIAWDYIEGAEEYDFEWIFKSDYDVISPVDFSQATRITTTNQHYTIPTAYDNGKIYYRVRPISSDFLTGQKRLEGSWTQGSDFLVICNFENRNWAYTASYAEEGKRKEDISYFDGSSRNRQSATISNAEGVGIVMETMYDYEGRTAVQTLPAPAKNYRNTLKFYQYLNLNAAGLPYSKKDFDSDLISVCASTPAPPPMNGSSLTGDGAAFYYSENNTQALLNNGFNRSIPDADNYPFIQTVYSNDGKVKQQTNVGTAHKLGSGHETKYLSATASQAKLDRIFGNEAGYAEHYRETVGIDPNGQLAVTYEDLSGRVIASALRGESPTNLTALDPGDEPYMLPEETLDDFSTSYDPATESFVTNQDFLVTRYGSPYDFSYEISPQQFHTLCTSADYDCHYKLEITITDDCNNPVTTAVVTTGPSPALNTVHLIDAGAYTSAPFKLNFTVSFPRNGVYKIRKRLWLNEDELNIAVAHFTNALNTLTNTCITPLADLEAIYEAGVDMTECEPCEQNCEIEAGSLTYPYIMDADHTFLDSASYVEYCIGECDPEIPPRDCDGLLSTLKDDMSPGGQYFNAIVPSGTSNGTLTLLTNFDYFIALDLFNPGAGGFYSDFSAFVGGSGLPALPAMSTSFHSQLAAQWVDGYADFLVTYHPEYCRWQRCVALTSSTDFDAAILSTNYADATTNTPSTTGYYLDITTPVIGTSVQGMDPFFSGPGSSCSASMIAQLGNCTECAAQFPGVTSAGNDMWDWADVAPLTIPGGLTPADHNQARWENFVKLYIAIKGTLCVTNYGCSALPDNTYPPDNVTEAPNNCYLIAGGKWIISLTGLTINDPEPTDNFNAILTALSGVSGTNPNVSPYDEVPPLCVYENTYTTAYIVPLGSATDPVVPSYTTAGCGTVTFCDAITLPAPASSSEKSYAFYVKINQVPLNPPLDYSADPAWPYSSCYIRISNPVTLPTITSSTPISTITAYLYQIQNAINSYYSSISPYHFTCTVTLPTSMSPNYAYKIHAPPLGPFGSSSNLNIVIQSLAYNTVTPVNHCDPKFDFQNFDPDCTPYVGGQNCLCLQLTQMHDFFEAHKNGSGQLVMAGDVGSTPVTYSNFETYAAAQLNTEYSITTPVTNSDVTFWWNNCSIADVVNGQTVNESPMELDSDNLYLTTGNNLLHPVPDEIDCDEEDPCQQQGMDEADFYALEEYNSQISTAINNFIVEYKAACLNRTALAEKFNVLYYEKEYHYTLYYYDQAGNLVRTVPPNSVRRLDPGVMYPSGTNAVHYARLHENDVLPPAKIYPEHSRVGVGTNPVNLMVTNYKYNTFDELIEEESPDKGLVKYWYNIIGQLRFSQNAKQLATVTGSVYGQYSYSIYDGLGRVVEEGENYEDAIVGGMPPTGPFWNAVNDPLFPGTVNGTQVRKMYFDAPMAGLGLTQNYVRGRVSSMTYEDVEDASDLTYQSGTHYSYDVAGNISRLVQDYPELAFCNNRFKNIDYDYDLISGNVNKVKYQAGQFDEYYHKYEYNADNRFTHAYTSNDNIHWQQDMRYFYYLHGGLSRSELGEDKVQGLDYTYTLHGWSKTVNTNTLVVSSDIGLDGSTVGAYMPGQNLVHKNLAQDVFGYSLEFYNNDYKSASPTVAANITSNISLTAAYAATPNLYNGNIKALATAMFQPDPTPSVAPSIPYEISTMSRFFKYDQLNRIKEGQSYEVAANLGLGTIATHSVPSASNYFEDFRYDANGNILSANRNGFGSPNSMDALTYEYEDLTTSNRLSYVDDAVSSSAFTTDIDDQLPLNYGYDQLGNLTRDIAEGITNIVWTVTGQIRRIEKATMNIVYKYDAKGNRVCKVVRPKVGGVVQPEDSWIYTYYVRDDKGSILAVYDRQISINSSLGTAQDQLYLLESTIQGLNRIGYEEGTERAPYTPGTTYPYSVSQYASTGRVISTGASTPLTVAVRPNQHMMGYKRYELANHLGNVNVVISDRKISIPQTVHLYYSADVYNAQDYFAFGAGMDGRIMPIQTAADNTSLGTKPYRYGFNGKENDFEPKNIGGSQQDYGMRIYDPRLGRFLSSDPLFKRFPDLTTYQFASNRPIDGIDLDGLEHEWYVVTEQTDGKSVKVDNASSYYKNIGPHGWGRSITFKNAEGKIVGTKFIPTLAPDFWSGANRPLYVFGIKIFGKYDSWEGSDQAKVTWERGKTLMAGTVGIILSGGTIFIAEAGAGVGMAWFSLGTSVDDLGADDNGDSFLEQQMSPQVKIFYTGLKLLTGLYGNYKSLTEIGKGLTDADHLLVFSEFVKAFYDVGPDGVMQLKEDYKKLVQSELDKIMKARVDLIQKRVKAGKDTQKK